MLLNSHCNSQYWWGGGSGVGETQSSADNALRAFLSKWHQFIWVFIPLSFLSWCVSSGLETLPQPELAGDAAWASCEPQDLMWAVKWDRSTAGPGEHPGAIFQRHFSSVPQHLLELIPCPVCVLRAESIPAVLQNWAEAERCVCSARG